MPGKTFAQFLHERFGMTLRQLTDQLNTVAGTVDPLIYKGATDCSTNPNYPAADAGHVYIVSVAGKIGGASGTTVEAGDLFICKTDDTSAGTQAQTGTAWNIVQSNLVGPIPVKATGAEVDTGTDDAKFVTPKAIADSGVGKTITRNAIGENPVDGLVLQNTTPAADGEQQWPPRLRLRGNVWLGNASGWSEFLIESHVEDISHYPYLVLASRTSSDGTGVPQEILEIGLDAIIFPQFAGGGTIYLTLDNDGKLIGSPVPFLRLSSGAPFRVAVINEDGERLFGGEDAIASIEVNTNNGKIIANALVSLELVSALIVLTGLPTSAPASPRALWDDNGTIKITPAE